MRIVDSTRARAAALPRRWPWLRLTLDVKDRFAEVHGGYLASTITLSTFVSLFPLLLVVTAVIGFVAAGDTDVAGNVISDLGLSGEAAQTVRDAVSAAEESRRAASIIGLVGLLWSGLGLVAALQYALDSVWQVKGRGLKDKLFGVAWLTGAGLLFLASFLLTALIGYVPVLAPLNLLVGLALGVGLFLWTLHVLCNRDVGIRPLLPGAILGAVGFEILKAVGSFFVPRLVQSSSALYGSIGTVFAILAWLFFFGRLIVLSSVLNVVLWERRHGTTTVEVEVPNLPGEDPTIGTRAGEASDAADEEPEPAPTPSNG